jgi:DNA-binding MarR family transcriptional regulator
VALIQLDEAEAEDWMAKRKQKSEPSAAALHGAVSLSIGLCNCSALRKASRRMSQLYDDALGMYGIKVTQRSILEHIAQAGAPSVSELADAMAMDRSVMTRNLQPLEREGWVKPLVDPSDRRSRHIVLTAEGQAKLVESFDAWKAAQAGFERAFGQAAAADLRTALGVVASNEFVRACHAGFTLQAGR